MKGKKRSISSDLKKLDKMTDADIDYSDIPPLDESFFTKKIVTVPKKKDSITLRIDHEVLEFFRHQGKGYQTLINAVLKTYVYANQRNFFNRKQKALLRRHHEEHDKRK